MLRILAGKPLPRRRERRPLHGTPIFEILNHTSRNLVGETAARPQLARAMDRVADAELTAGHHAIAERLAHAAAEIRAGGAA